MNVVGPWSGVTFTGPRIPILCSSVIYASNEEISRNESGIVSERLRDGGRRARGIRWRDPSWRGDGRRCWHVRRWRRRRQGCSLFLFIVLERKPEETILVIRVSVWTVIVYVFQELDEMKKRLKEMEEEAAALREMQAKVEKEMGAVQGRFLMITYYCFRL